MDIIGILRGTVLNPTVTAFARGLLEAVAFLVLYAIGDFVLTLPDVSPLVLMALPVLIRTGEGVIDKIDSAKQRQRDALREEAKYAHTESSPLQPGDVKG